MFVRVWCGCGWSRSASLRGGAGLSLDEKHSQSMRWAQEKVDEDPCDCHGRRSVEVTVCSSVLRSCDSPRVEFVER